jgi:hypothetical protein
MPTCVAINNLSVESPGSIAVFSTVGKFNLVAMGRKRTVAIQYHTPPIVFSIRYMIFQKYMHLKKAEKENIILI